MCFVPSSDHNVVETAARNNCTALNGPTFGSTITGRQVVHVFTTAGTFFFMSSGFCGLGATGVVNVGLQSSSPTSVPSTSPSALTTTPSTSPTLQPTRPPSAIPTATFVCDAPTRVQALQNGLSVWNDCSNLAQCCCIPETNRVAVAAQLNCTIPLGQPCPTGCCEGDTTIHSSCTTSPTSPPPSTFSPTTPSPTLQSCPSICCTLPNVSTTVTFNSSGGVLVCTGRCNPLSVNTVCTNRGTGISSFCASADCCNAHPSVVEQVCGVHGCSVESCIEPRCPAHCRTNGCFYNASATFGGAGSFACIEKVDVRGESEGSVLLNGEANSSSPVYSRCPRVTGVFTCIGYSDDCVCTNCDVGSGPCQFFFDGTNQTICQSRSPATDTCSTPYTRDCCRSTTQSPTTAQPTPSPTQQLCTGCAYGSSGQCMYRFSTTTGYCLPYISDFGCLPGLDLCASFQTQSAPSPTTYACDNCHLPGAAQGTTGTFGDCRQSFDNGNITFCMPFLNLRGDCLSGMQSCAPSAAPTAEWIPLRSTFDLAFSTPSVFSTVASSSNHLAVWNGNFSSVTECQRACADTYTNCLGVYEFFDSASTPQMYRCILLRDLGDLSRPGTSQNLSFSYVKSVLTSTTRTTTSSQTTTTTSSTETSVTSTSVSTTITEARSFSFRELYRSTGSIAYGARFSTAHNRTFRLFVTGLASYNGTTAVCQARCNSYFNHQCAGIYVWAPVNQPGSTTLYRCAGLSNLGGVAKNTLGESVSFRREFDCPRCGLNSGPCFHSQSRLCMEYAANPIASTQDCLPGFSKCDFRT